MPLTLQIYMLLAVAVWYMLSRSATVIVYLQARHTISRRVVFYGVISLCPFILEFASVLFTLLAISRGLAPARRH